MFLLHCIALHTITWRKMFYTLFIQFFCSILPYLDNIPVKFVYPKCVHWKFAFIVCTQYTFKSLRFLSTSAVTVGTVYQRIQCKLEHCYSRKLAVFSYLIQVSDTVTPAWHTINLTVGDFRVVFMVHPANEWWMWLFNSRLETHLFANNPFLYNV